MVDVVQPTVNSEEETINVETPVVDNSQKQVEDEALAKRHAEQEAWSKAEALRLRDISIATAVDAAQIDASSLLRLHARDPKIATDAAKDLGYSSWKEAEDAINKVLDKAPVDADAEDQKKYAKRKAQEAKEKSERIHAKYLAKSSKVLWEIEDENLRNKAQSYFDSISEWKKLTSKSFDLLIDMATLYAKKDSMKSDVYDDAVRQLASTGVPWAKNTKGEELVPIIKPDWTVVLVPNTFK